MEIKNKKVAAKEESKSKTEDDDDDLFGPSGADFGINSEDKDEIIARIDDL